MAPRLGRALVLAGAVFANAAPAYSGSGVSIDISSIAVDEQLLPGGDYRLPTFGVRNPGTEATTYRLVVTHVEGQVGEPAPATWFTFTPDRLTLPAAGSAPVATVLRIPPDAEPGRYDALIGPEIVTDAGGPTVGAGAVARLSFVVRSSNELDGWLRWLVGQLAEHPWLLGVAGIAAVALVGRTLRHRFTVRIERRR